MSLQHHNYGDREGEYERGGRQGMGKGEVEREGGEWRMVDGMKKVMI